MIETVKCLIGVPQTSDDLFNDILSPIYRRKCSIKNKSNIIPVYFYRYIGMKGSGEEYDDELLKIDHELENIGKRYLKIISGMSGITDEGILNKVKSAWKIFSWKFGKDLKEYIALLEKEEAFPSTGSKLIDYTIKNKYMEILQMFCLREQKVNETILKNFSFKILMWIHDMVPNLFKDFNEHSIFHRGIHNPKVMYYGDIRRHEIYFLIFLSKIGCDVLYMNSFSDGEFQTVDFENEFSRTMSFPKREPIREFPKKKDSIPSILVSEKVVPDKSLKQITVTQNKTEKDFEELAKLSNSIVMIKTFDQHGEFLGSGSGIIIDEWGLIATNYHVLKGGTYFEVVFEGMSEGYKYQTHTIINKDSKRDLALINIQLNTKPIEICAADQVRRGQKVVAIGSPLGLMNTVSDGIVSGFRNIGNCDFIQITAPISPGSSGGALLNMYGELIGITSAGYIDGQNINLAIPTKDLMKLLNDKWTLLNREIMRMHSRFAYNRGALIFDGFFSCVSSYSYKVTLYQNERNNCDFYKFFFDTGFRTAIENYYVEQIKNSALKYDVQGYDFEIGGQNHIFTYRWERGVITNQKWLILK